MSRLDQSTTRAVRLRVTTTTLTQGNCGNLGSCRPLRSRWNYARCLSILFPTATAFKRRQTGTHRRFFGEVEGSRGDQFVLRSKKEVTMKQKIRKKHKIRKILNTVAKDSKLLDRLLTDPTSIAKEFRLTPTEAKRLRHSDILIA